jgi:polyferredoxin
MSTRPKYRQPLRHLLLFTSLLLFPVTLYYFSPYLVIDGARMGVLTASGAVFAAMFVWSVLLGRAWCGWLCPGAGLMEGCFAIQPKPFCTGRLDLVKWFIWVPWLGAIVLLFWSAGWKGLRLLHHLEGGVSVREPGHFLLFYTVVLLFLVPSLLFGRRAGCHLLCWMAPFMILGEKLGRTLRLPQLHLRPEASKCTACGTCRRNCPMSLDVPRLVASGAMNHAECVLCGTCVDGCNQGAIDFAFGSRNLS